MDGSDPSTRAPDWFEIFELQGVETSFTFESLAKFHNDLWDDLDATLDAILSESE